MAEDRVENWQKFAKHHPINGLWIESPTAGGVWLVTLFCAINRYTIH